MTHTTDTVSLPKWIDDLKGRDPTIDALIEHIESLAPVAAIQPAGDVQAVLEMADDALTAAWSFVKDCDDIADKVNKAGIAISEILHPEVPAASAPAQPEAKGDYMPFDPADINPDGNFGDTVDFAAIVAASLAAPVPAAPADKGEWTDAQIQELARKYAMDDHNLAVCDEVVGFARAFSLADRARQAAIAQPSVKPWKDRCTQQDVQWWTSAALDALMGEIEDWRGHYAEQASVCQPSECCVVEGSEGRDLCTGSCAESGICAWKQAAPQPPSTGSIADDVEFRRLSRAWSDAAGESWPSQTLSAWGELAAYIDTRTAALIDAASKERGGDAARLDFLVDEEATIESLKLPSATKYRVIWPLFEVSQIEWHATPRAAIDAAMANKDDVQ